MVHAQILVGGKLFPLDFDETKEFSTSFEHGGQIVAFNFSPDGPDGRPLMDVILKKRRSIFLRRGR